MAKAGVNEGEEGGIFVEYFGGDFSDVIVGEGGGDEAGDGGHLKTDIFCCQSRISDQKVASDLCLEFCQSKDNQSRFSSSKFVQS